MSSRNDEPLNLRPTAGLAQKPRNSFISSRRTHEYEGFFPQHPSRGRSETSMSVVVPDRPAPLSSAPAAMAYRHDRRRDYFTDSSTLRAAMGEAAPTDAGIRYSLRDRSSAEPTDVDLTTSKQRVPRPSIHNIDKDAKDKGNKQRKPSKSANGFVSTPLFRRTTSSVSSNAPYFEGYGPDSHLPRFMQQQRSFASDDSRVSAADSDAQSPQSSSNALAMQSMLELEETRLLEAERKNQLQAVDSVLSEEQKVAYVGLVYLILVDMQSRLNVQYKESQSSTASFMNFSRRIMRNMYMHIHLSLEEQRMIELLPRHKVNIPDMAHSLAAQGDTIMVEADQDVAVMHDLFTALRDNEDCRSSTESNHGSGLDWFRRKKPQTDSESDIYTQYSMLPSESGEPEIREDIISRRRNSVSSNDSNHISKAA
ncbi:hypothetical protein IWW36_004054, partial [Coemansia brasiliensis]